MSKNYVCDGAKIDCQLCTKPEGTLMVSSNQIKIQGQLFANANDKEKTNLVFQGNCKASPYQASPCQGVIVPIMWQGTADTTIQDAKALLEDSTIMCGFGGSTIKITDHLQVNAPTELQPLMAPVVLPVEEAQYLELQWQDTEGTKITENTVHHQQKGLLKTLNILPGESLIFNVSEKDDTSVRNEEKKVKVAATVNHEGEARFEVQNTAQEIIEKDKESPQIEDMYWVDSEGNTIENALSGQKIGLYVKVANIEEGEELTVNLDGENGNRTILIGTVDDDGVVILK